MRRMRSKLLVLVTTVLAGFSIAASMAQESDVPQSGPAANGEPAWFILQQNGGGAPAAAAPGAPAPAGGRSVAPAAPGGRAGGGRGAGGAAAIPQICAADFAKWCAGKEADGMRCLQAHSGEIINNCRVAVSGQRFRTTTAAVSMPICDHSPICTYNTGAGVGNFTNPGGIRDGMGGYIRVEWDHGNNQGFKVTYPIQLPPGTGGAVSLAIDHHDNLWVMQRNPLGTAQLNKFSPDHKLLFTVPESVLGHHELAHGINVD